MFNREKYIEFKKDLQLKYPFLNIVSNNIGSFIDGDKGIFFIESSKSLSEEEKNRVLGRYGELEIYNMLKKNLKPEEEIKWVSKDVGDLFGYDIIISNVITHEVRLIEVKTSYNNVRELTLSLNEYNKLQESIKNGVVYEMYKVEYGNDEEKIFNTFTSLINKKYIEMVVTNNNGEVIEQIKLDPLYDRLALNKKTDKVESKDIYAMFESELGRTLSSFEYEMINKWLEKGVEEETIKKALKEAVLNNVRNFKYIDKIIYEWTKKGIKNKIKEDNKKDIHEEDILDFEWFDENE